MRGQRLIACLVCGIALAVLTAACAANEPEDAADDVASQEPDTVAPIPEDGDMTLDLETLEAETEFGALQAERAENSYVCPINEGQAIGIAFLDDVTAGEEQDHQQQIVVYLYDREELAVMIGEVDSEGRGTLESGDLSDFDATVELTMEDDAVSGTVTFPGEQPTPFTADAATGIAGVYWAHGTEEHADVSGDWIVLSDRRQWGCVCLPPYVSPCCSLRS